MDYKDELITQLQEENDKLNRIIKKLKVKKPKATPSSNDIYNPDNDFVGVHSGKTTSNEREKLREHLKKLVEEHGKQKNKIKPKTTNAFKIGQIVERINSISENYRKGVIRFIACREAMPSVRACDMRACEHNNKNYIWVEWKDNKIIAYHYNKLLLMKPEDLLPKIGKELSGKIGQWEFDATTGKWKKDGKEYTEDEFADILYFETHPFAKEEADDFLRILKKNNSF
jgi:hypothetical protein